MRRVNIVLLVLAGALAGAVLMRLVQRPVRVAMRAVAPHRAAPPQTVRVETKPVEVAETPSPMPALEPAPPAAAVESQHPAEWAPKPHVEPPLEKKPSPLRRIPATAPVAAAPHVPHTHPLTAEVQTRPASPPIQQAPPVLPEQPKETPPARTEPENVTPPSAPIPTAPQPNQATLNAGILIPVRLLDSISSERNRAGDAFAATLDRELVASGFVVAERGAQVEGRVTAADRDARTLSLELTFIHTSDNQDVPIQTERFDKQREPDHSHAVEKIGGGAAIGAVIGGIAAGGKGAAIGAGAGGGIGATDVLYSRKAASLPSETRLTFRLRAPVTITERTQ